MLKGNHPIISLYFLYSDVYYGIVLFHSDQSGGLPLHGESAMFLHLPQGDPSTGSWRSSGKRALWKIWENADRRVRKAKRGFVIKPWWTKLGQCLMWKVLGKRTRWALLAEGTHSTSLHQVELSCWEGPIPYLELFWVGPFEKKNTLYVKHTWRRSNLPSASF